MAGKGIVERNINPANCRQISISLTEYAKSLQEKYMVVSEHMNTLLYQNFQKKSRNSLKIWINIKRYCKILGFVLECRYKSVRKSHAEESLWRFFKRNLRIGFDDMYVSVRKSHAEESLWRFFKKEFTYWI